MNGEENDVIVSCYSEHQFISFNGFNSYFIHQYFILAFCQVSIE